MYLPTLDYLFTPLLNAQWYYGNTYNITYAASSAVQYVQIYLYKQWVVPGYITFVSNIVLNTPNTGFYAWTIPVGHFDMIFLKKLRSLFHFKFREPFHR